MASNQDQGTFSSNSQRTWLFNEGQYVMVGGESCEKNANTACTPAQTQILQQRITYLNADYNDLVSQLSTVRCKREYVSNYNRFRSLRAGRRAAVTIKLPT